MANAKIKATAELFLDTSNASKDAKKFVDDLKKKLSNIETAADKMTVFQDLVGYIAQIDQNLAALKAKNGDAFAHMFDGMDESFRAEFEKIFKINKDKLEELNSLRDKLNKAKENPDAYKGDLKNWEKQIKEAYALMGKELTFTAGNTKPLNRINQMLIKLDEFASNWHGVVEQISQGFTFGGGGAGTSGDSLDNLSDKIDGVKQKITELENELTKFYKIKDQLDKTANIVDDFNQSGNLSENLNVEMTIDSVRTLMSEYLKLSKVIKNQDSSSADYYANLIKQSELAMQLVDVQSKLQDVNGDANKKRLVEQLKTQQTKSGRSLYSTLDTIANNAFDYLDGVFQNAYNTFANNMKEKEKILDNLYVDLNNMLAKQKQTKSGVGNKGDNESTGSGGNQDGVKQDANFTSLENTIKMEASALGQKLNDVLKVELVKDDTKDIQNIINNIQSSISEISSSIENYKTSKTASDKQAQVNTMKANLAQLFKYISEVNAKKIDGHYQDQEIGAAILSDGSISTSFGEDGTVPWDRMASSLVANLTKTLLVDLHSHPWAEDYKGQKFANDTFSGYNGDLGAFRFSKQLGAQIAAMITGNIMRTLDLSKLTSEQMNDFRAELKDIQSTYPKRPEYSKYMSFDETSGKFYLKGQTNLKDTHKMSEMVESLMYEAFNRIGLSKDYVNQNIFKKYDLTNEEQLTALAERLVNLANSSQNALNPVERLAEIISQFGGDVDSEQAKVGLEGFAKGELSAAAVFNKLNKKGYTINQDTMDSLLTIDTAKDISAVESLLVQITSILNIINSNVGNIANNTRINTSDQYDRAIDDIIDLRNGIHNNNLVKNIKSIFDPLNISKYKNEEVLNQSESSYKDFDDFMQKVYVDAMQNGINTEQLQTLLHKFSVALSSTQDAMKQIELYEARTREEVTTKYGEVATAALDNTYSELTNSTNVQALLYLLSQAKIDLRKEKGTYSNGLGSVVSDSDDLRDNNEIYTQLSSIQGILDSIYGVLQGFTGIKSNENLGIQYSKPVQTEVSQTMGISEYAETILSNIESAVSLINTTLNSLVSNQTQQDIPFESLTQAINNLVTSLTNVEGSIRTLLNSNISIGSSDQGNASGAGFTNLQTQDEINQLDNLHAKLIEIKNAIDLKTQAFLNEATVVGQSVGKEVSALKHLLELLSQIEHYINMFSNDSVPRNLFDQWKLDLEAINNNIVNIASVINGINVPEINIQDRPNNGGNQLPANENGYALETTLQNTNGILNNILGAINGDNNLSTLVTSLDSAVKALNNVANGIVQYQKDTKTDTSVANSRIANKDSHDHIRDVALNALGDRALDSDVTEMKALANGVVQVTGWLRVAENEWEGFTVRVNEAGEASKLAFDANSKAAKRAAAEAEAARKASEKATEDDNTKRYDKDTVMARAQAHIDEYAKQGKNATVQYKDNGRYTISILEEIGGLSREIFQTFDENDEKIERITATVSSKTLAKLQDLQKVAEFGQANNLISSSDDVYKRYADANAELHKMNAQYRGLDNLSENDIVNWNTQIKLVQQLGVEVQKLVLKRKTSAPELFNSQRTKESATWNKDYAKLKELINIPASFTQRIQDAGNAIKNAVDGDALKIAKNNWAALRAEIEQTAIEQDLYIKKGSTVTTNKNAYGGNILVNATAKYNSLNRAAQDDEFIGSAIVTQKLKEYTDAYNRLVAIQSKFKAGQDPTADQKTEFIEAKDACSKYAQELKKVIDATYKLSNQSDGNVWNLDGNFDINSVDDRRAALQEFIKETYGAKAAIGAFNNDSRQLEFTIRNIDGTFTKMTASINAAGNKIRAVAGNVKEASSIFNLIINKGKGLFTYAISRFGVDEIFQQIRQGIQYVREIDSALTELKKVTNETDATYDAFLQTASKTAGIIGSTVSEFTNATADFARLGYNLAEATELAKAASVYKNVGDGIDDISQASESIISTMKAFGIEAEDAIGIVDRFNQIGNNFAISSTGIGEALQRSASALYEAGNSIDESIALVTAANSVGRSS